MKIVYCIHSTANSGGMERILSNKVNYLLKNTSHDIIIITADQGGRNSFYEYNSSVHFIDIRINYKDLNKNFCAKVIGYLRKVFLHYFRLKKVLLSIKPDIVVSMYGPEMIFLPFIGNSKKILEIHFSKCFRSQINDSLARKQFSKFILSIKDCIEKQAIKKYDRFVVLTDEDKIDWGNFKNIQVINNFISFTVPKRAFLHEHRVIAVGRLSVQKGFDILIDIWEIVSQKHPDWNLYIYGDGEEKEKLYVQISNKNLREKIFIKEPTSNIINEYMNSSFLVMTSRFEGMPMTLIEAIRCGLPIIAFDCKCGPRDIISNHKNGLLIPFGNIESMANAINYLIENENIRNKMGEKAFYDSMHYSDSVIMSKWINLFEQLLSEKDSLTYIKQP